MKPQNTRKNRKNHTPLKWLALHIAQFSKAKSKLELASMRASLADRLMANSEPIRERL